LGGVTTATEFRVLGPVQAVCEGRPLPLGGPKQRALLAQLLLSSGGVVPRDRLVDAIWGEEPPGSAKASLQVYVHGLRQVVGADRIETHGDGYRLRLEPQELDLTRFELLLASAERAFADRRTADAADDLDSALRLWLGPPLADLADQPVARAAAPRLEELRLRAVELRNDARLELGGHEALLPELEALVAAEPYRERLREQQILALYRAGRQKDALAAYRAAREAFVEELGMDPGPALQELERAILRQDPALAAPPVPAPRSRPRLPAPVNTLVGRRLEIAAIEALLRRDDVRLVTLTGPGGTGKTRLALAVAEALAPELRDGAAFVDLSTATADDVVLPAVAHALEIPETVDVPAAVGERAVLIVLDNLEQLGGASGPVAALLAAGPRVRLLATSRTPLRVSGEQEYPVPPLPVPEPGTRAFEELVANDAVRLFSARAQAVDPGFALTDANAADVARICRRLDGLPLAIELAAARTRVLTPAAIEERLGRALDVLVSGPRDRPARQQTLRATLDWSYDLLGEPERGLLASLSVFAGGWTLADADAVLGADTSLGLEALVDSSLVRRRGTLEAPRFELLETIRAYAAELPAGRGGDDELRRRHALHFGTLADDAWQEILAGGDREAAGYEALEREHDNVRAAIAWAQQVEDVELEARIAIALRWFWLVRGHLEEGRRVFAGLVATTGDIPELHAQVLVHGASFPWRLGDIQEAQRQWAGALELFRELGDEEGVARCIAELGAVATTTGELDRALELYEEAAALFERLGNRSRLATALANLAAVQSRKDDAEQSAAYGARAIEIQRELGELDGLAVSLVNLARVQIVLGDQAAARRSLHECLSITGRIGYQMLTAYALGAAAELARVEGEPEQAARLVGASAAAFAAIGMPVPDEEQEDHDRTLGPVRESLGEGKVEELLAGGRAAPIEQMLAVALDLTR
jgi:predicted ATPase/DNA-binding SARP family transcriptional activator